MGLKDVKTPFYPSEADLVVALTQYFNELGYRQDEIKIEESFEIRLGHTQIQLDQKGFSYKEKKIHGRSDLLITRNGRPLAIVEAKAPDVMLTEEDADQGLSYARLLKDMPPFTIVTNGQELRVYDTFSAEIIKSGAPNDSIWCKNNNSYDGLGSSIKSEEWACKTLFRLDYELVKKYCQKQVQRELRDIKGERLRYWPEIYLGRDSVTDEFSMFQRSNQLFFGLVGESGSGKTNELCSLAESVLNVNETIALFYRGNYIAHGILEAIRSDFMWEFEKDDSIVHVIKRLDEIVREHHSQLIIFIDGIDEYPDKLGVLKAELVDVTKRLDASTIRLCVSCKPPRWEFFIKEADDKLNHLGLNVFSAQHSDNNPGCYISLFNDDEIDKAWNKYRKAFNIKGSLAGETRQICRLPLMMRLVAEAYQDGTSIPEELSNLSVFDNYWQRKIGSFASIQEQIKAELLLSQVSEAMIETDQIELKEIDFFRQHENLLYSESIYDHLLNIGLLIQSTKSGEHYLSFRFEKILLYVYCYKAKKFHLHLLGSDINLSLIKQALLTRLGKDCVVFFLSLGEEKWLTRLLQVDISVFVKLMQFLEIYDARSEEPKFSVFRNPQHNIIKRLKDRGDEYLLAYSQLREQFPALKDHISPYTSHGVGLLVYKDFYCFRGISNEIPEKIVVIDDRTFVDLSSSRITQADYERYLPDGRLENTLLFNIQNDLASRRAYIQYFEQIATLLSLQLFNESKCPALISERVVDLLAVSCAPYLADSPRGKLWELLGFSSYDEALSTSCLELLDRTLGLRKEWLSNMEKISGPLKRWYEINFHTPFLLIWYLQELLHSSDRIIIPEAKLNQAFSAFFHNEFDEASKLISSQVDELLTNYRLMVEENFPGLLPLLPTYQYLGKRLIVEVTPAMSLSFIWLSSSSNSVTEVRFIDPNSDELAIFQYLQSENRVGKALLKVPEGGTFSYAEHPFPIAESTLISKYTKIPFWPDIDIEFEIDEQVYKERNALISSVKDRGKNSLHDQVYQLIYHDLSWSLGTKFKRELEKTIRDYRMSNRWEKQADEIALSFSDSRMHGLRFSVISSPGKKKEILHPDFQLEGLFREGESVE